MSVLECANKLLKILPLNNLPPKLRWSENGDLKFSDSNEGEGDSKKTTEHWDNIALPGEEFILNRGKHTCSSVDFGAFPQMDQRLHHVVRPAREPTVFELIKWRPK